MPRLFDCFQMSELSYTKWEGQGLFKSPRLLGQWMNTQGGGGKEGIGVGLRERTHESGSDPCNSTLQTMCSLSISAVLGVEHTTPATAKGVALVGGRTDGFTPLSPSLFNAASIQ